MRNSWRNRNETAQATAAVIHIADSNFYERKYAWLQFGKHCNKSLKGEGSYKNGKGGKESRANCGSCELSIRCYRERLAELWQCGNFRQRLKLCNTFRSLVFSRVLVAYSSHIYLAYYCCAFLFALPMIYCANFINLLCCHKTTTERRKNTKWNETK